MPDAFASISRFDQILGDLRQRVAGGEFPVASRLPSERALAADYGCSQATMNKVVATLIHEGQLCRRSARGAFVPVRRSKQKTIRFMGWIGAETISQPIWADMCDAFAQDHPEICIETIAVPFEQCQQQLTERIAGGDAPDVVQIHSDWASQFASMGALLPLTDSTALAANNKWSAEWMLQPNLLFYNRAVMAECGLDPDRPPASMTELMTMSKQVVEAGGGRQGFLTITGPEPLAAQSWLPFLYAFGGVFHTAAGEVAIDTPAAVEALTFYKNLLHVSNGMTAKSQWAVRDAFVANRAAFVIEGSAGRGFLGRAGRESLGVAPIPAGSTGRAESVAANHSLAVLRQSAYPDEAIALVHHLRTNRALLKQYYEREGMVPAAESVHNEPAFHAPFARLVLQQSQRAHRLPSEHATLHIALAFLSDALDRALSGRATAEDALGEAAHRIRILFRHSWH